MCAPEDDFVPLTVEDIRRRNDSPNEDNRHRFLVELDGVPVGLAVASADPNWPEKKGFMDGPGVVPEHRRKRIGTALVRALLDDLQQRGMTQAELTGDDCAATNGFCARLGFKVVRSYAEMRCSLESLPQGLGESKWVALGFVEPNDENLATFISIQNEAFKDYYDYRPWTVESMKFRVASAAERGNPTHFLFARAAGAPVGYL